MSAAFWRPVWAAAGLLLVAFVAVFAGRVAGADPVHVRVHHLLAPGTADDVDAVSRADAQGLANARPIDVLFAGPWAGTYWLRVDGLSAPAVVSLSATVDAARLYWRADPALPWQVSVGGDQVPAAARSIDAAATLLPVPGDGPLSQAYLEIHQRAPVGLRLVAGSEQWASDRSAADRRIGLFLYGFVAAIIAYNLLVSAVLGDRVFLFNALTILCLIGIAAHLAGWDGWIVWRERPWIGDTVMNLSLAGANAFGLTFVHAFLARTGEDHRGERMLRWPVPVFIALAVAAPWLDYGWMRFTLLMLTPLTLVAIAAVLIGRSRRGDPYALILLVPFGFGVLPAVALTVAELFGAVEFGVVLRNGLEVCLALEALLFSLVIALRVRTAESARATAERALHQARDQLAGRILEAQDRERRRVAQDLHDSAGQRLLFLINTLRVAGRAPEVAGTAASQVFDDAAEQAAQVLDGLRRISRNMHPASLDHLGWSGAVRALIDSVNAGGQLRCLAEFALDEARLDPEQRLHLYRIVQEALSNIVRHADARFCRMRFCTDDDAFTLEIEDHGRGLPGSGDATTGAGLGLTSMRERVRMLAGSLTIGPRTGGGTRLVVRVPLGPAAAGGRAAGGGSAEGGR